MTKRSPISSEMVVRAMDFLHGQEVPGRDAGVQEMDWCAKVHEARKCLEHIFEVRLYLNMWKDHIQRCIATDGEDAILTANDLHNFVVEMQLLSEGKAPDEYMEVGQDEDEDEEEAA